MAPSASSRPDVSRIRIDGLGLELELRLIQTQDADRIAGKDRPGFSLGDPAQRIAMLDANDLTALADYIAPV